MLCYGLQLAEGKRPRPGCTTNDETSSNHEPEPELSMTDSSVVLLDAFTCNRMSNRVRRQMAMVLYDSFRPLQSPPDDHR